MARPSARANSALVTGSGAARLIGPDTEDFSIAHSIISIQSSMWIHDMTCRPDAIGPPANIMKGSIILGSAPPSLEMTTPERVITSRQPSAAAGAASASHATQSLARKSDPGGDDSSIV